MRTIKGVFTVVAMSASLSVFALTETVNGITWTYTVSNGGASLAPTAVSTSTSGAITIPSTLGGCPVTSIGAYAFSRCSGLTSVTIPAGVTSIGSCAFNYCSRLTSVDIPNGVTSIGTQAFSNCRELNRVTIAASVTNIGSFAFSECASLMCIYISDHYHPTPQRSEFIMLRNSCFSLCSSV